MPVQDARVRILRFPSFPLITRVPLFLILSFNNGTPTVKERAKGYNLGTLYSTLIEPFYKALNRITKGKRVQLRSRGSTSASFAEGVPSRRGSWKTWGRQERAFFPCLEVHGTESLQGPFKGSTRVQGLGPTWRFMGRSKYGYKYVIVWGYIYL